MQRGWWGYGLWSKNVPSLVDGSGAKTQPGSLHTYIEPTHDLKSLATDWPNEKVNSSWCCWFPPWSLPDIPTQLYWSITFKCYGGGKDCWRAIEICLTAEDTLIDEEVERPSIYLCQWEIHGYDAPSGDEREGSLSVIMYQHCSLIKIYSSQNRVLFQLINTRKIVTSNMFL